MKGKDLKAREYFTIRIPGSGNKRAVLLGAAFVFYNVPNCLTRFKEGYMYKTIIAATIGRLAGLSIPPPGKRCFVTINSTGSLEMVYNHMKTKPGGVVWFFVCPVTGKHCRKLHLVNGAYVHASTIPGHYRKIKPLWVTGTGMDKLLIIMQGKINAEKLIDSKYFKPFYNGKPTKKYLKCLSQIEAGEGVTMSEIVNGKYNYLLQKQPI